MSAGRSGSSRDRIDQEVSVALARETDRLARLRFYWWTGLLIGFTALAYGAQIAIELRAASRPVAADSAAAPARDGPRVLDSGAGQWIAVGAVLGLMIAGWIYVARTQPSARRVAWIAVWLIVINHLAMIVFGLILEPASLVISAQGSIVTHVLACLLLPWTPWQALAPLLMVLPLHQILTLLVARTELGEWGMRFTGPTTTAVAIAAAIGLQWLFYMPGMTISIARGLWRRHRFRTRFISDRYSEVRRDLGEARRLHESLFPPRRETGPVRVDYVYEPMRDIGGDFLHLHDHAGSTSVVLVDVTGHGVSAALMVNRLHRELDRLLASQPDAAPGAVIERLNQFLYQTASGYSMYATAICCRVNTAANTLEYASAGHPPVALLPRDGACAWLDSTALVLGAVPPEDYKAEPQLRSMSAGDVVLLYTDGLIEARGAGGRMLGMAGLRDAVARGGASDGWCAKIRALVDAYRVGEAEDDMLVVEVRRTADA